MNATVKSDIVERLKTVVLSAVPEATVVEKYGGIVFEKVPGQTQSQFCGVFTYQNHVSLEFTKGAELEDPDNVLVGGGKLRRHIKLTHISDIALKQCEDFVLQAINL